MSKYSTFKCFCRKCENIFQSKLHDYDYFTVCPHCLTDYELYKLPLVANQILSEASNFCITYTSIIPLLKIQFEQDYKGFYPVSRYFNTTIKSFKRNKNKDYLKLPRLQIVAFQFVAMDKYRFIIHDKSINPKVEGNFSFNDKISFDNILQYPYKDIYQDKIFQKRLTYHELAHLVSLTNLYQSYYEQIAQTQQIALYPEWSLFEI